MEQLVINIPKEIRQALINNIQLSPDQKSIADSCIRNAILNGIPLAEGHGRIMDEKEIDTVVNAVFSGYKCSPEFFLKVIHEQCIEIIGADETESEE